MDYQIAMTTNEYRAAVATLGMTYREISQKLGISHSSALHYSAGRAVPLSKAIMLRTLLREQQEKTSN